LSTRTLEKEILFRVWVPKVHSLSLSFNPNRLEEFIASLYFRCFL